MYTYTYIYDHLWHFIYIYTGYILYIDVRLQRFERIALNSERLSGAYYKDDQVDCMQTNYAGII